MAKEDLSAALSEPVALAESHKKLDSATLDEATSYDNTAAPGVPIKLDSASQSKPDENDLEDVSVEDGDPSYAPDEGTGTPGDALMEKNIPAVKSGAELAVSKKDKTNSGLGLADEAPNDDLEAPSRPTRPDSPLQQIKRDLKDAFPQIEDKYIEACLIASEGHIDPAFNALLYLLDPSFKPEPVVANYKPIVKEKLPFTDDELLARQLQKEFDKEERRRKKSAASKSRQRNTTTLREESDESPDEIDQLKEQFSQGFEEAKTTINGWVSGLTKKFSQEGESGSSSANSGLNTKLFGALGGSSFNLDAKNRTRTFDEDPEILSLDFSRNVDLKTSQPPKLPRRLEKSEQESRWQPLNSDVPVSSDAFLVTDLDEEERK